MAINVATGVITARLLGPAGRGEFAAASIWFLLPSQLATVGLQSAVIYRIRHDPEQAGSIGGAALLIGLGLFVPAAGMCFWILPMLMHAYGPDIRTLALAAVFAAGLNVWMTLSRDTLLGTRNVHLFNLSVAGSSAAYLTALLLVTSTHSIDPATALYCQFAGTVAILIPTLWCTVRGWRWQALRPWAELGPLARYSGRAAGLDLVTLFHWNVDRIILIGLIEPAAFGLYAVAASFARILGVLQAGFSSVMLADTAHQSTGEIERYVHHTFRLFAWILMAACVAGWLLGEPLLRLVYGEGFAPAVVIFRFLLLESAVSCLCQVLVGGYLAVGRPGSASTIQCVYCVLLLFGLLMAAPIWGAIGAAIAMLCAIACKLVMLLLGLRRIDLRIPGLRPVRDDFDMLGRMLRGGPASAPTD